VATSEDAGAELAGAARDAGLAVTAVGLGTGLIPGADTTLQAAPPAADEPVETMAGALADLLQERGARVIAFSADATGRLLAGQVGARLGASPKNVGSVVSWEPLTITRVGCGGLAQATEEITSPVAVLVVGPGALGAGPEAAAETYPAGAAEEIELAAAAGVKILQTQPKGGETVNLAAAKRVVGVGRGFAAEADLALARALADKLGAEMACSRPIAEGVGWMSAERYIGVSGTTIKPDLYVAIGISGQVQHMVGVGHARKIVAINKDKSAPIFAQADMGAVGDLYQILPALAAAL
jgi:electron transfer flavoprotein alpha subunit